VFYMPWIGPLLAPGSAPPTGGAETQIFLVTQALAARGLRVCIVAFPVPGGLPEQVGEVDVIARRPYSARERFTGKLTEAFAIWRALGRLDTKVVVTRASGPHVGIAALSTRLCRRRFVYSSANVVDFTFELETERRNLLLYKLGLRLADMIVVQTEEQADLCRRALRRESVVIKSLAEPAEPRTSEPQTFLWVGRAIFYKHPLKFLELARRVPEARFQILAVPDPQSGIDLMEQLKKEVAELPNVELVAPRPREAVLKLMDEAVAIVNTADYEGLANIFLEGWARGVPSMALSHDPDGIVVRHDIGWYADGSMDRFAEQAREAWARRHELDDVAERCRRYVDQHHSADAVAAGWRAAITGRTVHTPQPHEVAAVTGLARADSGSSEAN
jgi:glycosyltransferase involved in cell wall biosynthesis